MPNYFFFPQDQFGFLQLVYYLGFLQTWSVVLRALSVRVADVLTVEDLDGMIGEKVCVDERVISE